MATVTFDKATRLYPGATQPAVDKLNLEIADGEFLVLVGPSGCGKSTSLRMLAGLEDVNDGAIRIGEPRRHRPAAEGPRHRDGVPELRALPAHDGRREHGLRAQDRAACRKDEIAQPGARGRRSCSTSSSTSTASRRRSPVASASASRWAARSSASRRCSSWTSRCPTSTPSCACRPARRSPSLQRRLGVTTVYVTHDQVEAMTMGDRVAVLKDGMLQQVDTPRDLYDQPGQRLRRRLHRLAGDEPARRPTWSRAARSFGDSRRSRSPRDVDAAAAERREAGHHRLPPGGPRVLTDGRGPARSTVDLVEELGADALRLRRR